MRAIEDFLEKCYCNKVLATPTVEDTNTLTFECDKCGYTYVIHFTELLEAQ